MTKARRTLWRLLDDPVASRRRMGLNDREIARELAEGLSPEELWAESAYWLDMDEDGVADELADLAEKAEEAGYAYLAVREGAV